MKLDFLELTKLGQLHGCSLASHVLYLTNLSSRVYVVMYLKTVALLLTSIETEN